MNREFTQDQLDNFTAYEAVRQSGIWNMFSPQAMLATGLHREDFLFVMENYSALRLAAAGDYE